MPKENTLVPFVLLVGVAGVLLYGTLTSGHDWGDDFSLYIMQAKSLTEGAPRGFIESNRFTVEQSSFPFGPIAAPWGFPVLLAPFYAVFGLDMIALKTVGVLSYLLFLVLLWFGFRRAHSRALFLCLVCLFALNPGVIAYSNAILSDLPFLFFSTLSVVLIGRMIVEERRLISPLWDSVLIGVAIAAAFFIRTNGILLLVTLGLSQIVFHMQKRCRDRTQQATEEGRLISLRTLPSVRSVSVKPRLIHWVPYAVFLSLAVVWGLALPEGGQSHAFHLKRVSLAMINDQLHYYLDLPSDFFSGAPHPQLWYGASIPLAVVGMIRRHRSDYPAIIYVALTLFLSVIWPERQGLRYLFPVLPFYISFALSGLEMLLGGPTPVERRVRRLVCYIPVFLVIFYFGKAASLGAYYNLHENREVAIGPFTATSQSMFSFVKEHTEENSTVIFFKPRVMRLMTGRKSVMISNMEQISRGDYLCLYLRNDADDYQVSPAAIRGLLEQGSARLVYMNSEFSVFALSKIEKKVHNNSLHRA